MRIINFEPEGGPMPPGSIVARFDALVGPIRLNGLLLRKNSNGDHRVFAPKLRGVPVADLDRGLAAEITTAAVAALGGRMAHVHKAA